MEAVVLAGVGLVSPDLAQVHAAQLGSDEIEMLQRHRSCNSKFWWAFYTVFMLFFC